MKYFLQELVETKEEQKQEPNNWHQMNTTFATCLLDV